MDAVLSKLPEVLPPLSQLASALPLLKQVAELSLKVVDPNLTLSQRRDLALQALEKLAAGADGVLGTADDRIPEAVVEQVRGLLASNLATDLLAHFQALAPEPTTSAEAPNGAPRPGFLSCFACFRSQ